MMSFPRQAFLAPGHFVVPVSSPRPHRPRGGMAPWDVRPGCRVRRRGPLGCLGDNISGHRRSVRIVGEDAAVQEVPLLRLQVAT